MSIYIDSCPASIAVDPFGPVPGARAFGRGA
jgi:hypothetical protein